MKYGVPDFCPKSVVTVGALAEGEGWRVIPSYVTVPERNITLRFRKDGYPSLWAAWRNGGFHCSYANTGQRLSYRDIAVVLKDPSLLTDVDPEWPFGPPEETDYFKSDRLMCGRLGHEWQADKKRQIKCVRCGESNGVAEGGTP